MVAGSSEQLLESLVPSSLTQNATHLAKRPRNYLSINSMTPGGSPLMSKILSMAGLGVKGLKYMYDLTYFTPQAGQDAHS